MAVHFLSGASIGTADESGLTALMYAAKEGQEAAAHLLLQNGVCLPPNIF
jgi:ankyrin repeat protein